jgi:hypothetical protein
MGLNKHLNRSRPGSPSPFPSPTALILYTMVRSQETARSAACRGSRGPMPHGSAVAPRGGRGYSGFRGQVLWALAAICWTSSAFLLGPSGLGASVSVPVGVAKILVSPGPTPFSSASMVRFSSTDPDPNNRRRRPRRSKPDGEDGEGEGEGGADPEDDDDYWAMRPEALDKRRPRVRRGKHFATAGP